MENNTVNIDVKTGKIKYSYTAENNTPFTEEINYNEEVNKLIRIKYSESEEYALLRQKDDKPDKYNEYFEYCEWAKSEVKSKM